MKLKNKKTGKIGNFCYGYTNELCVSWQKDDGFWAKQEYTSLAELNEGWEDYEEPKGSALDLMILTLTNFIENEPDEDKVDLEDCKNMLEKLKAFNRLKEAGFRFDGYDVAHKSNGNLAGQIFYDAGKYSIEDIEKEMDLLFGGEE